MSGSALSPHHRTSNIRPFGWLAIVRLGLAQFSLGAIVVLTTSTLNRVMVIELMLPALLPGLLVALHYAVQMLRPRMGYGSDMMGRSTPWIIGGMTVLGLGGVLAATATTMLAHSMLWGTLMAVVAFSLIGLGVSASGTSVLVLLAKRVEDHRRAAAATIVWLMMITGLAMTAGITGQLLDPYSHERLLTIATVVSLAAIVLTVIALAGLEGAAGSINATPDAGPDTTQKPSFQEALAQVWREPAAKRFTVFVFVSMLAFSAQDLILEPFAGLVFQFTPGETTALSGLQHAGVLSGMILVAFACGRFGGKFGDRQIGSLRSWTVGGCIASSLALFSLVAAGQVGPGYPLKATVFLLGASNGAFSIAAIASMMRLAGEGRGHREGTRVGLWGAAQAIAFGAGGLIGATASDIARRWIEDPGVAYGVVFFAEAGLFLVAARLALGIDADLDQKNAAASTTQTHAPQTPAAQAAQHTTHSWKTEERHEPA
jgi:BCD family chlorophyll transporter-like MFS transporter